jgi:hypothetical protein
MTTLSDIRTRVRTDLRDTEPSAQRWTDTQLDRHIERALHDLDRFVPREATATFATTPGSRDVSLSSVTGLIDIDAVEFPVGDYPPCYAQFSRWEDTLTLLVDRIPAGGDLKLFYTAGHVLDGSGSTVPGHLEELLAIGAAGYAALELASYDIEQLNLNPGAVSEYSRQGRAWLTAFQQLLHHHGRNNTVRTRRLYRPAS